MLDEGNDVNLESPAAPPPEESNNRTFLIVGGVFAALIFLTLVCGAVYVLWYGPRVASQRNAAAQGTTTANAVVIQQMTTTAEAALFTPTEMPSDTPLPTETLVTDTPAPSVTPVLAVATDTGTPTTDPATLAAMQTQLSQQMTSTMAMTLGTRAIGGEGMPTTGFFDQVALPTMLVLTVALIAVIFLARRLRKAPSK
jgi:hypothetical protein